MGAITVLGEIWEVPEPLLRKRMFPERATEAHKTMQEYDAWIAGPRAGRRHLLPVAHKLACEYVRSVWRLPLRPSERVMCSATALYRHYRRHNHDRVQRWKGRLGRLIGKK